MAKYKNVWCHAYNVPHAFMVWSSAERRNNCNFILSLDSVK